MSQDFSSFPSKGTEAGTKDTADVTTVPPTLTNAGVSAGPARVSTAGTTSPSPTMPSPSPTTPSTTAKEQAGHVAKEAADAGALLAGTAKEQAGKVGAEAKTQVKDLLSQTQRELRDQAGTQQTRVAGGLRSLGDELGSMARNSDGTGVATDLVQQLSTRADGIATWLDNRDPGSLLGEVRNYARQHPGTFIAIAATAGLLAGRLTRSIASATSDNDSASTARESRAHRDTAAPRIDAATLPAAAQVPEIGANSYAVPSHPDDLGAAITADPYRGSQSDPYRRSGDLAEGADDDSGDSSSSDRSSSDSSSSDRSSSDRNSSDRNDPSDRSHEGRQL